MRSTRYVPFVFTIVFLICIHSQAANRVLVKAVASEDYVKERALDEKKKIQTYQFIKGRYFGGLSKNSGMENVSFTDVVQDLAVQLTRQGFYPNPVKGEGDLLISVHYGVTDFEESYEDQWGITSLEDLGYNDTVASAGGGGTALEPGQVDAINNLSFNLNSTQAAADSNEQGGYYKAQLLGMEEAFSNRVSPQDEYELKSLLQEERYFVILMAYDYPSVKRGKPELVWSTRYSIRAYGQNFEDAIKGMNVVAGDFFGKNLKGLSRKRVDDASHVEMGDIEVIDDAPTPSDKTN